MREFFESFCLLIKAIFSTFISESPCILCLDYFLNDGMHFGVAVEYVIISEKIVELEIKEN